MLNKIEKNLLIISLFILMCFFMDKDLSLAASHEFTLRPQLQFSPDEKGASEWQRAFDETMKTSLYIEPLKFPESDIIDDKLREIPGVTQELIGTIDTPLPEKLLGYIKHFLSRVPWANAFGYSMEDFERIIGQFPPSYNVYAYHVPCSNDEALPSLVILGGVHGNESHSVNTTMSFLYRLMDDLSFIRQYFSKITVIPRYCPHGCNLGLRIGVDGMDPVYLNPNYSESSNRVEERIFRKFMDGLDKPAIVVDLHGGPGDDQTTVMISKTEQTMLARIIEIWQEVMKAYNFTLKNAQGTPLLEEGLYSEGIYYLDDLTAEFIKMRNMSINISIEAGAEKNYPDRVIEAQMSTLAIIKALIDLSVQTSL